MVVLYRVSVFDTPSVLLERIDWSTSASAGEKQRVASVLDLFDGLHRDARLSLVVVTHSQEVAERAERVLTIRDGRLVI